MGRQCNVTPHRRPRKNRTGADCTVVRDGRTDKSVCEYFSEGEPNCVFDAILRNLRNPGLSGLELALAP